MQALLSIIAPLNVTCQMGVSIDAQWVEQPSAGSKTAQNKPEGGEGGGGRGGGGARAQSLPEAEHWSSCVGWHHYTCASFTGLQVPALQLVAQI